MAKGPRFRRVCWRGGSDTAVQGPSAARASPRSARADEPRKAALARSREDQRHVVELADNLALFYLAPKTPGLGFPRDVAPGQRRAANRDRFSALRAFDLDVLVILMDAQPKIAALPYAARLGGDDPQVKRAFVALARMRLHHVHGLSAVGLPARHGKSVRDHARAGLQLVDKPRLQPVQERREP